MKLFILLAILVLSTVTCARKGGDPPKEEIAQLTLKRGDLISCGTGDKEFGIAHFPINGNAQLQEEFNLAIELLHSFEYDESEKVFARIVGKAPSQAMAYWGIAMCSFHPLWEPPSEADLRKGSKAVEIARSIQEKSAKEAAYINAIGAYYKDWEKADPFARSVRFEKAMEQLAHQYPDDHEAAIFYALALNASADPTDKSFGNQRKAGDILTQLYQTEPNHPGIVHYLIHTLDYPGLAEQALPAARRYAAVAPSSAHALHMPSHIFTRLGLWDECAESNKKSVEAANCYAKAAGIAGHWDEELHGMDYLVYAYLQNGNNRAAMDQLRILDTITKVYPVNFKVAYAFAAIPARIALENKDWKEAAHLRSPAKDFPWQKFPWQEAIIHFTRVLGLVHTGNFAEAESELQVLAQLQRKLMEARDGYKANQVAIQMKAGEAWIRYSSGKKKEGLALMNLAANMEDSTTKHPVTPGEVIPARELYADMLLQDKQYNNALAEYGEVLKKSPNRLNSVKGVEISRKGAK